MTRPNIQASSSSPGPQALKPSSPLLTKNWPVPRFRDKWRILVREADRLSMSTLPDRLAELYGERPALFLDQPLDYPFFRGDCVTHTELAGFVARIAHGLQQLGVKKGDRVGLMTGNRIEAAFAEFATQRLGAVPVLLSQFLCDTPLAPK